MEKAPGNWGNAHKREQDALQEKIAKQLENIRNRPGYNRLVEKKEEELETHSVLTSKQQRKVLRSSPHVPKTPPTKSFHEVDGPELEILPDGTWKQKE